MADESNMRASIWHFIPARYHARTREGSDENPAAVMASFNIT